MGNDRSVNARAACLLWAGGLLALFLIAAKAVTLGGEGPAVQWALTLFWASWRDVFVALSGGALGAGLVWLLRGWPRLALTVRWVFLVVFAFWVFYAVVAIGVFQYFHRPLTFNLLSLVGNAETVRSSIAERLTWPIAFALIVSPLLYLWLATRRPRSRVPAILCLAATGWGITGFVLEARGWQRDRIDHVRLSPHWEMLRTSARRLLGHERPRFPRDFPAEDMAEFRTFAGRGGEAGLQFASGQPRPRNVILIILESVGMKYLGLYGAAHDPMPALTAEARHALVFENIYAHASLTYAAFRPLLFSVYPGLPWRYALLDEAQPLPETLAAKMKERGARTAYITSGDLDWGDQRWILGRTPSFDLTVGAADLDCPLVTSWGAEDRCAIDRLLGWIAEEPARPFFGVVWTDQTHDPYRLSKEQEARIPPAPAEAVTGPFAGDLARYLRVLRAADAELARVFAFLRERGLADDTLVVVTGDHGEAFGDPHSQRGHAWSVYEEEVRLPLLLWNPRLFPEGGRVPTLGGQVDINSTIADILGLPPAAGWQGWSLFDPRRPARAYFFSIAGGNTFGVREGDWKYSYDVTSGDEALYHLSSDPTEQTNLATREPDRARRLRQRVAAFVAFTESHLQGREN